AVHRTCDASGTRGSRSAGIGAPCPRPTSPRRTDRSHPGGLARPVLDASSDRPDQRSLHPGACGDRRTRLLSSLRPQRPPRPQGASTMNTAATPGAATQTESAVEIGRFLASWSPQRPLRLHSEGTPLTGGPGASLVEIFTAQEQRSRTSQAYYRSGVGGRLRVTDLEQVERNDAVTIHVT